jgi:hypothetical protein
MERNVRLRRAPAPPCRDITSAQIELSGELKSMSATPRTEGSGVLEQQWRSAIVEVERVRSEYAEHLRAVDRDEAELERLWLQLWIAERRRDELFRTLDRMAWRRSNS